MAIQSIVGSAVLKGLTHVLQSKLKKPEPAPASSPTSAPPAPAHGLKDALTKLGLDTSKLEGVQGVKPFVKELFSKLHAEGKGNFQSDLKSLTSKLANGDSSLDGLKEKFNQLATALNGPSTASLQGLLQNLGSGEETKGTLLSTAA